MLQFDYCCNKVNYWKIKRKINKKYDNFVQLFLVTRILFMALYSFNLLQFLAILFLSYSFSDAFYSFFVSIRITCFLQNPYYISFYIIFYFIAVLFFLLYVALVSLKDFFLELLLYYCNFFPKKFLQYLSSKLVLFFFFFFFPLQFSFSEISMLLFLLQQFLVLETILQRYTSIS